MIILSEEAVNTGMIVIMANTEDFKSLIHSKELTFSLSVSTHYNIIYHYISYLIYG